MNLEYVHIHVIYRVNQAKDAIRTPVAAPQAYVNTYSTRRVADQKGEGGGGGSPEFHSRARRSLLVWIFIFFVYVYR